MCDSVALKSRTRFLFRFCFRPAVLRCSFVVAVVFFLPFGIEPVGMFLVSSLLFVFHFFFSRRRIRASGDTEKAARERRNKTQTRERRTGRVEANGRWRCAPSTKTKRFQWHHFSTPSYWFFTVQYRVLPGFYRKPSFPAGFQRGSNSFPSGFF